MKWLIDNMSLKSIRRLIVLVIGSTVILFGLLLSLPFVPGPGFVAILAGLAILATEFVWAKMLLKKVREHVKTAVDTVTNHRDRVARAPQSDSAEETTPESTTNHPAR